MKKIIISLLFLSTHIPFIAHAEVPFSWHDKWLVPFQASKVDARFPYMMYAPASHDKKEYPLVVLMHGTERTRHPYLKKIWPLQRKMTLFSLRRFSP